MEQPGVWGGGWLALEPRAEILPLEQHNASAQTERSAVRLPFTAAAKGSFVPTAAPPAAPRPCPARGLL